MCCRTRQRGDGKRHRHRKMKIRTPSCTNNLYIIAFFLLSTTSELLKAEQNQMRLDIGDGNDNIVSRCPVVRERRSWDNLSCDEQDAFLTNVHRLKKNGVYDTFVRVHIENEAVAHGTAEFLPWHRWFIYQFELALRSVADPPYKCMSLPYWDWELDAGNEETSSVFLPEAFSSFEGVNRNGRCRFQVNRQEGGGSCLHRRFNFDFPFWGEGRIVALILRYLQYGDDFSNDRTRVNGFRAALEGGPHAAPHNFIGGSMIDENAPNDPLFWIHHANIDRIWSLWQDYHGHTDVDLLSYSIPMHYEGHLLDVPMPFRLTNFWDFRIRNLRGPTPREVLSNNGILLNVRYVHENPIPSEARYIANRQWFGTPNTGIDQCDRRSDENHPRRELQPKYETSENGEDSIQLRPNTIYNANIKYRGLRRNRSLKGENLSIFPLRSTKMYYNNNENITSVEDCLRSNNFRRLRDRENWNDICKRLLNRHHSLQERLDQLARQDCEELGNPQSAMDDYWIERMGMSNGKAVFECYHIADESERQSS